LSSCGQLSGECGGHLVVLVPDFLKNKRFEVILAQRLNLHPVIFMIGNGIRGGEGGREVVVVVVIMLY